MKITQSMYKDYLAMMRGEMCGLYFEARWIKNSLPDQQSEKQAAGWWFEDMVIRKESTIEPTKTGGGGYNALFSHLWNHIDVASDMIKGLTVIKSNQETTKGNIKGKPDLVVYGKVIDIKTSGHINNKWDAFGWGALVDSESKNYELQLNDKKIQAMTYCLLEGVNRFEFWVFSNSSTDVFRFGLTFTNEQLSTWELELNLTYGGIEYLSEIGFTPNPEYNRCRNCPVQNCSSRHKLPNLIELC